MDGKRLKELRIAKKLSQKNLAKFLGIDRTTYSKYESGYSNPNVARLKKLAQCLGTTVDFLLGENNISISNEGANTFPRSYVVKTTTYKKRPAKKKPTAKTAACKLPKIKWNEEISMGTIDTDALPGAKISLCRKGDEKFIVLESDTARFGIPIQSALPIAVTLENSIEQAKKLEWL